MWTQCERADITEGSLVDELVRPAGLSDVTVGASLIALPMAP